MRLLRDYVRAYRDVYRWMLRTPVVRWVPRALLMPGTPLWNLSVRDRLI